ncbi:MAG TPA: gliding motility-associated C-terminal domain-containing protein [Ohtaekwangia sp.]|nr:gliding motility-associated C-terminal domain-containing protein [Ohtaekwangia sp.]
MAQVQMKNAVTNPGTYWVEVSNRCEAVRETVTLRNITSPEVDLGSDITTCDREVTLQYSPAPDETLLWSDGSTSTSFSVKKSGTYQLTVNNGCVETMDEIQVTIKVAEAWIMPNVVTYNNDGKNDHFLLPSNDERCSLLIYNRWGKKIYSTDNYQSNWPTENLSTGVYFYTLKRQCMPALHGAIHLLN